MYIINKIVGTLTSPLGMAIVALSAAGAWALWKKRWKGPAVTAFVCAAWLWVWGTCVWSRVIGLPLETGWTQLRAEELPAADAIVLLGGGMSANPAAYPYPDMHGAADRVWHAARLFKAGKAPLVMPTGAGDRASTVPLLVDFGVPEPAIRVEDAARNTEENAKLVETLLLKDARAGRRPKALLVTSAWHMRRSLLMYRTYAPGIDVVAAPADFENTMACRRPSELKDFFPSAEDFHRNSSMLKELVGYWGYRLLR